MAGRRFTIGVLAAGFAGTFAAGGNAESLSTPAEPAPAALDEPSATAPGSAVERQATGRGLTFYPSTPRLNGFRLAVGAFYDAIDPEVMYGYNLRVPQVTVDARYGLGSGWSLKGHLNTIFVTNELLIGGSFAGRAGQWSFEGALSAGVYVGKLAHFAFDALFVSPEYRPELTVGYDFGRVAVSLRGSLLLMGPVRARVGDVWGGFDNAGLFAGHSEMLFVENTTRTDSVWYFAVGAMTTRAYYALWLLFPDSPSFYTYPRVEAGYEI